MVYSVASVGPVVPPTLPRNESLFATCFSVTSDASTVVVLDTWNDPRLKCNHTVHGDLPFRFVCFSPLFYDNIVIGSVVLFDFAPKTSYPMKKVDLLESFGRITTEMIDCDAKRRLEAESKYLRVLCSWPSCLSEGYQEVTESFRGVDSALYRVLSVASQAENTESLITGPVESMSTSLSSMNVRLDVIKAVGGVLLEYIMNREAIIGSDAGLADCGLKPIEFADLLYSMSAAVEDFGCHDNFKLTIDQTAESLHTISTFPNSVTGMLRCLFAFFDHSRIILNALCVVVIDQLDFRSGTLSATSTLSGQLCFEFVAIGTYIPSPSFAALWGYDLNGCASETQEVDCLKSMTQQFEWLRDIIIRMGGGMSWPKVTESDREKYNSCASVSIWLPCLFQRADLINSKEILLSNPQSLAATKSLTSPILEDMNYSIAPSELIKQSSLEAKHAVLVIDDSILVQKMFKKIFSSLGIACEVASSGITGLELMKSRRFGIVFVDFIMPGQGGVSTIRRFSEWRMNELYSGMFITGAGMQDAAESASFDDPLLIVGMSGSYDGPAIQEGFRNGIKIFLMKPVSREKCKRIYEAKIGGELDTEYAGRQLSDLQEGDLVSVSTVSDR